MSIRLHDLPLVRKMHNASEGEILRIALGPVRGRRAVAA